MKKTYFILPMVLSFALLLTTCKKEKEIPPTSNKIEFGDTKLDSVNYWMIEVTSSFEGTGRNEITEHGHCWATSPNPSIKDSKTVYGPIEEAKDITTTIKKGIIDNTTYYIRSYFTYEYGTAYNDGIVVKTLKTGKPEVYTSMVTHIQIHSVYCGGNVVNDSGYTVAKKGVCWGLESQPTIEDCVGKTENGSGLGGFTSHVEELKEGTTFFIRAYASNQNGTGYGDEKTFNTTPVNLANVETGQISHISYFSAVCGGNVVDEGNGNVSARGICWGTNADLNLENALGSTVNGNGPGFYSGNVINLLDGIKYYVVAYATNETGTAYGAIKSFNTIDISLPSLSTASVSSISFNGAHCGGNISNNGNGAILARGCCWGTVANPTLENNTGHSSDGPGLGDFTSILTGLTESTTYYVAAYATNALGTAYGSVKIFNTDVLFLPTVQTGDVSNIAYSSANCAGTVTQNGNGNILARGVCWSKSADPTLENNLGYTTNGIGLGGFVGTLSQLDALETYYVTAFATNEKGTAYGTVSSFETLDRCGFPISYEGKSYATVRIGDQCWMSQNLNVGQRINGSQNMSSNSTIEKYCYNDDVSYCEAYGALYQWGEVMKYSTIEGAQGLCPDGWHLPSDDEWKRLEGFADSNYGIGDPEWNQENFRGSDAGYRLKSISGWSYSSNGSDAFGFTAKPAGYRNLNGDFYNVGSYGEFWTSTKPSGSDAWGRTLKVHEDGIKRSKDSGYWGRAVRCVLD
jgi:uncharacterized protein (TIGR02145 family)